MRMAKTKTVGQRVYQSISVRKCVCVCASAVQMMLVVMCFSAANGSPYISNCASGCQASRCTAAAHSTLGSATSPRPLYPTAAVCVILARAFHPRVSAAVLCTFAAYAAFTVVLTRVSWTRCLAF